MKMKSILVLFLVVSFRLVAQETFIAGRVMNQRTGHPIAGAEVFIQGSTQMTYTNESGEYHLSPIKPGKHQVAAFYSELSSTVLDIEVHPGANSLDLLLHEFTRELAAVTVADQHLDNFGIERLNSVSGFSIYEAKKTEVIVLDHIDANKATNNARQIYAKVPGLNIWESDGAGLQLGIGARGLDPNRTSNFNVRQNGYDISADALGYPESYYTPPSEAIEKIEVVRGAASLQYGTQFGGLLNFVLKHKADKPVELVSRQTAGSFGLFNSFNSLSGNTKKISYYTFYQHKQGDGWRPNSSFNLNMAYGSITFKPSEKFSLTGQYTFMHYLAQQPGGLTDAHFAENPRQSIRDRNWFTVDWNLIALLVDYHFSESWKLNGRIFSLLGGRDALGNLGPINRVDVGGNRDLFSDDFTNLGMELRLMHHYHLAHKRSVLLTGVRLYNGFTHRRQGEGPDGIGPDFNFIPAEKLAGSDFDFNGRNASFFVENILDINPKLSFTPGVRLEFIQTLAEGYYQEEVQDVISWKEEDRLRSRSFLIGGLGVSYKPKNHLEVYGNLSQNYRAINFNDIRVNNPNLVVDENIRDEKGFNLDVGVRGGKTSVYNFDVSLFYLKYDGRIGLDSRTDYETFRYYRIRTNVGDSQHLGIEAFGQIEMLSLFTTSLQHQLTVFGNVALTDARYIDSQQTAIVGKKVEYVPQMNTKIGFTWKWNTFQVTTQGTFVSQQFTDASNAPMATPSSVEGPIPAYYVLDLSARYAVKIITLEAGVNNLANNIYFTRRATGYPGPGILPADARNFYITLGVKI